MKRAVLLIFVVGCQFELPEAAPVDAQGDVGIDASPDASIRGCLADFNPLPGMPAGHRFKILGAATWVSQSAACTQAAAIAYLAIPKDPGHLSALKTLANTTPFWVGIHDMATDGTFVTVRGAPQTFLPWAAGEPDNGVVPSEDCVAAVTSTLIKDDRCDNGQAQYDAVCECEP